MTEIIERIASIIEFIAIPMALCALMIILCIKYAHVIGIVDRPTERKKHSGNIPLVGGIAMFVAFAMSCFLLLPNYSFLPMLAISLVLLLTGTLDDYFDLSSGLRLIIQSAAALLMILVAGTTISSIGNLTGGGPILLATGFGTIFTMICAIGVVNSINMLDGMDGLAGSILLVSFTALGLLAWTGNHSVIAQQLLIVNGALVAFLCFNGRFIVERARVFMGDSGSMFLGFILCWYCLELSQGSHASLSPVSAGWIFGLPLADTISVVLRRLVARKSPFSAGRDHLHHLLMDSGVSVNKTLSYIVLIHSIMVFVGILITLFPQIEPTMFWVFVLFVLIHFTIVTHILIKQSVHVSDDSNTKKLKNA